MEWYWILAAVFILGIGVFLWGLRGVAKKSREYQIDFSKRLKKTKLEKPDLELQAPPTLASEPEPVTEREFVEFAAFVPRHITPDSHFLLDIWAYLPSDYNFVCSITRELSRDINVGRKIGIPISRGSFITIMIDIPSLKVSDNIDTLVWIGKPANTTYIVEVPVNVHIGSYPGKAVIASDGIPIAKLSFLISVTSIVDSEYIDCSVERKYVKTAFASYANENREEVLSRIQGMKKIAPELDVFLDVISLRSGQNWQVKLEEHVPTKDTFYLFWSQYAARSEWVEKEWRLALRSRGLGYIDPVPLEEPNRAPPPQELKALHFSDAYLAYIIFERIRKEQQREIAHC